MNTEAIQKCINEGSEVRIAVAAHAELESLETAFAQKDAQIGAMRVVIGLFNSMILGGEDHTDTSLAMMEAALSNKPLSKEQR